MVEIAVGFSSGGNGGEVRWTPEIKERETISGEREVEKTSKGSLQWRRTAHLPLIHPLLSLSIPFLVSVSSSSLISNFKPLTFALVPCLSLFLLFVPCLSPFFVIILKVLTLTSPVKMSRVDSRLGNFTVLLRSTLAWSGHNLILLMIFNGLKLLKIAFFFLDLLHCPNSPVA